VVKFLQKYYSDADQVVITTNSGKIIYSTDNWDVKNDIKGVLTSWTSGTAQFVVMNSVRYSILQMQPERLVATNRHKEGHLIGATTPNRDKYVFAHVKTKAKDWFHMAYPSVARAAAMLDKGEISEDFIPEAKKKKRKKEVINTRSEDFINSISVVTTAESVVTTAESVVTTAVTNQPYIDPILKQEIENFLQWIEDPQGLPSYINYYLQQNDQKIISALSIIYKTLYRIVNS